MRARWLGAEPGEWDEPTGRRRDLRVALICLTGGLVLLALNVNGFVGTPRYALVGPLVVMCGAVMLRRVAPVPAILVGVAAGLTDLAIGPSLGTILVFTQVGYDVALYGRREVMLWVLRLAVAATIVCTLGLLLRSDLSTSEVAGVGVTLTLVLVVPVSTAVPVRQFREKARLERERAEQIAELAELARRQALADERARMARELHDVVANHLSAVAIHATAAQSIADLDPARLAEILAVIRENSVRGLAEMRRMVEVLRDPTDPDPTDPDPDARLDGIERLLDDAPGLRVRLAETGERPALPADVDHAAYRIVQESLTNAGKHAAGGSATVCLEYREDAVVVTVDSSAPGGGRRPAVGGAGMGLRGMRERVTLLGGGFTAGPHAGGWRVPAELPL